MIIYTDYCNIEWLTLMLMTAFHCLRSSTMAQGCECLWLRCSHLAYGLVMIEDEIRARVGAHYAEPAKGEGVLMLSDLGAELRAANLWPLENDRRSLAEVTEQTSGVVVVRHPTLKAFIVVAPTSCAGLAHEALQRRDQIQMLRKLPRPILIAFCLDVDPSVPVHLRRHPPFRYVVGELNGSNGEYIAVEPIFRVPGLFASDPTKLTQEEMAKLAKAIAAWAARHGVQLEEFAKHGQSPTVSPTSRPESVRKPSPGSNALERLLASQSPDVAAKMIVPIDIAVALSKMA
jgi:hypothetical protein